MDNLEEFIKENRNELDKYKPPSHLWKSIHKKVMIRKIIIRQWISAASIVIIVLGATLLFINKRQSATFNELTGRNDTLEVKKNNQLKETEIYYNNLANSIYREASPLLTRNPEIRNELNINMAHLDSICDEIRKDLKDNVANQDVVEALIQNYRIKIQVLEEMITILKENQKNPEKKKDHEL